MNEKKTSKIYEQLNTKTRVSLDIDTLNQVTEPINIQQSNEYDLMTTLLIGLATNNISTSGPIPRTAKIIDIDKDVGGIYNFFIPKENEVWIVTSVSTGVMNVSSAQLLLSDGSGTYVEVGQENAAGVVFDPTFAGNLYIDNNVYLAVSLNSLTGSTNVTASFIRVR